MASLIGAHIAVIAVDRIGVGNAIAILAVIIRGANILVGAGEGIVSHAQTTITLNSLHIAFVRSARVIVIAQLVVWLMDTALNGVTAVCGALDAIGASRG